MQRSAEALTLTLGSLSRALGLLRAQVCASPLGSARASLGHHVCVQDLARSLEVVFEILRSNESTMHVNSAWDQAQRVRSMSAPHVQRDDMHHEHAGCDVTCPATHPLGPEP